MHVCYTVESTPEGWTLSEGGEVVTSGLTRSAALRLGCLLGFAAKAAGGTATLSVDRSDVSIDPDVTVSS